MLFISLKIFSFKFKTDLEPSKVIVNGILKFTVNFLVKFQT